MASKTCIVYVDEAFISGAWLVMPEYVNDTAQVTDE